MRKVYLLILISIVFLTGCSKETIEDIKSEKDGIRGVVKLIDSGTFTMDSRDRMKQGEIIVTRRIEGKNESPEFDVGDTITVYYDKIEDGQPARINRVYAIEINKKVTPEDLIENKKGELGIDEIDFYEMPLLTAVKDGQAVALTDKSSALIHNVVNTVEWDEGAIENFDYDFIIMDGAEEFLTFDSKSGTINDENNNISVVLYEGIAKIFKESLEL